MPILRPFSPSDPTTWPQQMRIKLIVKDPKTGYPGCVDISRHSWLALADKGLIHPGVKIGTKTRTWSREVVLDVARNGVPASPQ